LWAAQPAFRKEPIEGCAISTAEPLFRTALNGHEAVVKQLLTIRRMYVDSKDPDGRTPLWWATSGGHGAVVSLLLETEIVDTDSKDSDG
jgi:ankyrin repeat protein